VDRPSYIQDTVKRRDFIAPEKMHELARLLKPGLDGPGISCGKKSENSVPPCLRCRKSGNDTCYFVIFQHSQGMVIHTGNISSAF
jgi:hypothetical protein